MHLLLGSCYEKLDDSDLAIEEYLRTITFNLSNSVEMNARYFVARQYFYGGGFAQAKHQLEAILSKYKMIRDMDVSFSIKYVYKILSNVCKFLGEKENSKHYKRMAKNE